MTSLHIHRWCNEYQVPRNNASGLGSPAMQAVNTDLDRLTQRIADSFAAQLETMLAGSADEVVLVPELDIAFDLDLGCPAEQMVQHWSGQLARAFLHALEDPAGGVVRFASRAAYCASFIGELARGYAWDGWFYRCFEGLRMLPAGAAIRTLLTEASGLATLRLISPAAWPHLPRSLSRREAVRILCFWHRQTGERTDVRSLRAVLDLWRHSQPALPASLSAPLLALWLLAHCEDDGHLPPIGAISWVALLLSLRDEVGANELRRLARSADLRALAQAAGAGEEASDMDWISLLVSTPAALREAVAGLAASARLANRPNAASDMASIDEIAAPFGGLAWLLPALQDLLGPVLRALLPPHPNVDVTDLASLTVIALAAGDGSAAVFRDPFWRSFFGVAPAVGMQELHSWLEAHCPQAFNRVLTESLRLRALTPPVTLRFGLHGSRAEHLVEQGSACLLHCGEPPDCADLPLTFLERLSLSRLVKRDIEALQAAPIMEALPLAWRGSFLTMAQAVLRRTAYRIPGAACSSLPYLFANILGVRGEARVENSEDSLAWSLELNRPPLFVLLSLNGMARQRLRWHGGRALTLHCTG